MNIARHVVQIETNENDQVREQGLKRGNHMFTFMSKEELKIRNELQKDIERDLEEEIKDEIYHMALKLHRLYAGRIASKNQQGRLSHLSISIRLDGGTKIEIKETKKQAVNSNPRSSKSNNPQTMPVNAKKFDWEKSLRSGKYNPVIINKRSERSSRVKTPRQ
ncbi:uncharacterized protein LOC119992647 [Tripterygium wilfordii]|uniref:uncharacterized protein LOC119992647 n=1 Tax=Tripterygium wilfordii TaxID=458696 RepID=UPI0018F7EF01|nr:uncharacterized protein LOC119992647 [Tripterygium wilfordii]